MTLGLGRGSARLICKARHVSICMSETTMTALVHAVYTVTVCCAGRKKYTDRIDFNSKRRYRNKHCLKHSGTFVQARMNKCTWTKTSTFVRACMHACVLHVYIHTMWPWYACGTPSRDLEHSFAMCFEKSSANALLLLLIPKVCCTPTKQKHIGQGMESANLISTEPKLHTVAILMEPHKGL